jgi:ABC-type dipeptide/oligopeptide/nickel transport system ATPase subunit
MANPGLFVGLVAPAGCGKTGTVKTAIKLVSFTNCLRLLTQPSLGVSLGISPSFG